MELSVTLIVESLKKSESDSSFNTSVNAKNDVEALVIAKKVLKLQYQDLILAKVWCWFVEGPLNRKQVGCAN